MANAPRGPLGGATNTPVIDQGTSIRGRSPDPGWSCPTRDAGYLERAGNVDEAWELAKVRYATQAIARHTEGELAAIVEGLLPGLFGAIGLLLAATLVGGAAGAVFGGAGAIPAGAASGFGVGLAILEYLGLVFLAVYIGRHIGEASRHFVDGFGLAWNSCGQATAIDLAAREMAEGVGVLFAILIQALVAYALEKGFAATLKKVNGSKLGEPFGDWFRDRYSLSGLLKAVGREPGDYVFAEDSLGRPTEAEGWLVKTKGGRDPKAQAAVTDGLTGYHGGHLIPDTFGGPGTARNLVPMPEVTNLSYVKAVENAVGRHLEEGPVYLKVNVEYSGVGKVPSTVRHRFYRIGPDGMEMIPGGDVTTNLGITPSARMGAVTTPKDFLSPDPTKGVINKLPQ